MRAVVVLAMVVGVGCSTSGVPEAPRVEAPTSRRALRLATPVGTEWFAEEVRWDGRVREHWRVVGADDDGIVATVARHGKRVRARLPFDAPWWPVTSPGAEVERTREVHDLAFGRFAGWTYTRRQPADGFVIREEVRFADALPGPPVLATLFHDDIMVRTWRRVPPWTSVAEDAPNLPLPHMPEDVLTACRDGASWATESWTHNGRRWRDRVRRSLEFGAPYDDRIAFWWSDERGRRLHDEPVARRATDVARFSAATTTRREERRHTKLGELRGWTYATLRQDGDPSLEEQFYADGHPCLPLVTTTTVGRRRREDTRVRAIRGPWGDG